MRLFLAVLYKSIAVVDSSRVGCIFGTSEVEASRELRRRFLLVFIVSITVEWEAGSSVEMEPLLSQGILFMLILVVECPGGELK